MKTLRKPESAKPAGGRGGLGPRLAMIGLALLGLVGFEGCQSGCGSCGFGQRASGFGQRISSGVQGLGARIFHRRSAPAEACCEGSAPMAIEGGTTTILPGPVITSPPDGGSVELAPATPSSSTKPNAAGSKDQGSLRSSPTNGRLSYETRRPVADGPRPASSERTNIAAGLLSSTPESAAGGSRHPLDDIPPVDLSKDVTLKAASAPVPVEAERLEPPVSARIEAKDKEKDAKKLEATSNQGASAVEPPTAAFSVPPVRSGFESSVSPGIARFNGVEPNLAGGGLPTKEGLEWLKEKGYRTFVDLRDRKDVANSYVDEVNKLGLRYVSLPFPVAAVDPKQVRAFRDEIAKADSRPIYFCDEDGTRPALLWYVLRVSEGGVDAATARREAEEIGPLGSVQAAADAFLKSRPAPAQGKSASTLLQGSAVSRFAGMERGSVALPEPKSLNSARIRPASPSGPAPSTSSDLPLSGE